MHGLICFGLLVLAAMPQTLPTSSMATATTRMQRDATVAPSLPYRDAEKRAQTPASQWFTRNFVISAEKDIKGGGTPVLRRNRCGDICRAANDSTRTTIAATIPQTLPTSSIATTTTRMQRDTNVVVSLPYRDAEKRAQTPASQWFTRNFVISAEKDIKGGGTPVLRRNRCGDISRAAVQA